jgi:biofilm PGA synthesis protein PgaA
MMRRKSCSIFFCFAIMMMAVFPGDGSAQQERSPASEEKLDDAETAGGFVPALLRAKEYEKAEVLVGRILERDFKNIDALFWKGELLEKKRDYMAAYKVYEKILRFYPGNQGARDLKYRALMDMNANSLAREKLEQSKDRIDPEVLQMLWGNESMARIRWKEPETALKILERNKVYAESPPQHEFPSLKYPSKFILRTDYDRILALRQKEEMQAIVREYDRLKEIGVELPYWVVEKTGDAYLYLQQPEKALASYKESLRKQLDSFGQVKPESNTMMSIYHALMELGAKPGTCRSYREAGEILARLDSKMPVLIIERGILQDNWRKADVVCNSGWFLLYQGRLAEGQRYFEKLHLRGPLNTNIRTALAHTYLWRGWPRRALEEFEIVRTLDPKDISGANGYCYALDENDRGGDGRKLAGELLAKYPANKHVQGTNRRFAVKDMRTFIFDSTYDWEYPGVRETYWSARFDQPLAPWRGLFARVIRHDVSGQSIKEDIWRAYLGTDWRLNRDWWFTGSLSADEEGGSVGASSGVTFNPNDYLSFGVLYDSYSLDVPLQALAAGVKSEEWSLNARYRRGESFSAEGKANFHQMSDDNKRNSYSVGVDRALTTGACWKTRLALEGCYQTNLRGDVPYFSPENVYSVYLAPSVRHTWYHRYNRRFVDSLVVGLGKQKQKRYPGADVWYVRYAWDCDLSDTLAFVVGAAYSRRNYDGGDVDVWGYYLTLKKRF